MTRWRMSHVCIAVSELDRSLRFYHDALGFRFVDAYDVSARNLPGVRSFSSDEVRMALLEREGVRVELREGGARRDASSAAVPHLCMRVEDLEEAVAQLRAVGVEPLKDSRVDVEPGGFPQRSAGGRALLVADPDGGTIEIVETAGDL